MLRRIIEYFKFLRSLFKTNIRLMWGMWKLTKLPHPAITVFGGARIPFDSEIGKKATELTKMLAESGFSIITGGGPGIMEAANLGAVEFLKTCKVNGGYCPKRLISAGVGLIHLNLERTNPYVQESIVMRHFFSRKWLLVRYSVGFIIFPGGFGTLDELFEIVTLIQCNRMLKVPIILIDRHYWSPLMDWIETRALKNGMLNLHDLTIIRVTDSVQEAADIIRKECLESKESVFHNNDRVTKP